MERDDDWRDKSRFTETSSSQNQSSWMPILESTVQYKKLSYRKETGALLSHYSECSVL